MSNQVERWDNLAGHHPDASVIDPRDTRGRKNHYVVGLRNTGVTEALAATDATLPVLDFGCGTGGLSRAIVTAGRSVLGVDISGGLLARTPERDLGDAALFVRYDGIQLPVADASVGAITTYVVLNHLIDDTQLHGTLTEFHRVLARGGRLIAIEQVRRRPTVDLHTWQHRRTIDGFLALFAGAGFAPVSTEIVRYGRLPTTYAVRYGLLPESLFPKLVKLERSVGRMFGVLPWDYCDVRFVVEKR